MSGNIRRGEIILVDLNPVKGKEQGKIRPVLVVQNNVGNKFSPLTIVVPITSKEFSKDFPTNVFLKKSDSGLDKDSTVLCNQIRCIDKERIVNKLTSLSGNLMKQVDFALKKSLGLE